VFAPKRRAVAKSKEMQALHAEHNAAKLKLLYSKRVKVRRCVFVVVLFCFCGL
jgi:hypothetical protein